MLEIDKGINKRLITGKYKGFGRLQNVVNTKYYKIHLNFAVFKTYKSHCVKWKKKLLFVYVKFIIKNNKFDLMLFLRLNRFYNIDPI